jgi:hypothetical protein
MPRIYEPEKVFLQVGFESAEPDGKLRTIEIIGIPGEKLQNGDCVVSAKAQQFFDDLVARPLFRESRRLRSCDFQYLKIWLYDPEDSERGYEVPKIDHRDLEISPNIGYFSKLQRLYVLDNGLKGLEYERWKKMANELFIPLFKQFVAPPKAPDTSDSNLFSKMLGFFLLSPLDSGINTMDKYGKMKQSLFFNTLIIQID